MGRWETYLGFHRFPASFSTGSLLTKSGWYFFVFKYIYICGCIYQLPSPIYKMVFQIFYKMEVPDSGIWSCSHIKWCWVYKQVSFYKMECPDGTKKNHKIWFIGDPRPTILNGKCQRGLQIGFVFFLQIGTWHLEHTKSLQIVSSVFLETSTKPPTKSTIWFWIFLAKTEWALFKNQGHYRLVY